jgi:hypothetical protein
MTGWSRLGLTCSFESSIAAIISQPPEDRDAVREVRALAASAIYPTPGQLDLDVFSFSQMLKKFDNKATVNYCPSVNRNGYLGLTRFEVSLVQLSTDVQLCIGPKARLDLDT